MTRQSDLTVTEVIYRIINIGDDDPIDLTEIDPGVDLSKMNLREVNLSEADVSGVDVSGANLPFANLIGANFDIPTFQESILNLLP